MSISDGLFLFLLLECKKNLQEQTPTGGPPLGHLFIHLLCQQILDNSSWVGAVWRGGPSHLPAPQEEVVLPLASPGIQTSALHLQWSPSTCPHNASVVWAGCPITMYGLHSSRCRFIGQVLSLS
jgi:hypothetical protein